MRAQDLINLEGAASTSLRDRVLDCSQLFDPLPKCNLDVRHLVDGEGVHVRERTARDVHVVGDQRLDPGLVREQRFEVLPLMLDDRPEIDEEDVVDLPRPSRRSGRRCWSSSPEIDLPEALLSTSRGSVAPPQTHPLWLARVAGIVFSGREDVSVRTNGPNRDANRRVVSGTEVTITAAGPIEGTRPSLPSSDIALLGPWTSAGDLIPSRTPRTSPPRLGRRAGRIGRGPSRALRCAALPRAREGRQQPPPSHALLRPSALRPALG